ncbi:flavodoxin family protein [Geothrix sp. PMB-07]|uniref:flavodoxin family protein n=1 Tax=Geothrix sp. PMB-07 TaxID=3068640 RepID=UPI0035592824
MRQPPVNVVGFSASPRAKGSTAWVVETILEGARDQGMPARYWSAADLDLQPCRACFACRTKDRRCVIQDDMAPVHASILEAQALVLGAPIFMGQMSAQAKIFLDRLHPFFAPRFSPTFQEEHAGKALVLAFVQGNPDPGLFQTYVDYTRHLFMTLEFDVRECVVVAGTRSGEAPDQADLRARLKGIGASLAT